MVSRAIKLMESVKQRYCGTLPELAEDIRTYLALPRGSTEEEKRQYNESLNRAVLGYAEERERILAVIADRLLRQRIHELPEYKHPYSTLAEALFAEVIGT